MTDSQRYPDDWKTIATGIKAAAGWCCQKCGKVCLKPGEDKSGLSKSDRMVRTLVVHHCNYRPEDNRPENLIAVCTGCHLGYHQRRRGNVAIGQLELDVCIQPSDRFLKS